ncbi:MAG: methenyltetrahydrofolate cyclohydrolase [Thermoplasmata archaeon]|nr:MAG: methenyltetrahydrofolate cyclohydrolase [Thermoplasmata archaeon]
MDLTSTPIGDFLDALASKSPTPGGGSVAALSGAMAAALMSMVAEVTLPKKKYKVYEAELRDLAERSKRRILRFRELMQEDVKAFDAVIEAMRLPKDTPEQAKVREERLREALLGAADVPRRVGMEALEMLREMQGLHGKLYKFVVSDLAVAASMARAAVEGAAMNMIVNASSLKDEAIVEEAMAMVREAEGLARSVFEAVKGRLVG